MEKDMTNSTPQTKDTRRSFFGHIGGAAVLGLASLAPKGLYAQTPAARPDGPKGPGGNAEMRRAPDYQELLKKGYGHIGRVGFLSPGIVDETLSGQFYRMAPPGVTLVRTSLELRAITIEEVNAALARAERAAAELGKYGPDCIVFGGSPTVAVPGFGSDKVIVETIERASGRKAFSAQAAAIEALQKYGAKKLALATPFPDNVNVLVKDFLEKSGFEVLSIRGSGVDYVDLMRRVLPKPGSDPNPAATAAGIAGAARFGTRFRGARASEARMRAAGGPGVRRRLGKYLG
jgi:maleate cis-trans isomerase